MKQYKTQKKVIKTKYSTKKNINTVKTNIELLPITNKDNKYIYYNLKEVKIPAKDRTYYSFKIIDKKIPHIILGIIEFHLFPQLKLNNYQLSYFLTIYLHSKSQGKGVAKIATDLLIKKIKEVKPNIKSLYSMVNINNEKMIHFATKHNYELVEKNINFHNKKFNIYKIKI